VERQPDFPGPGEQAGPDLDAETRIIPIPDGEMPGAARPVPGRTSAPRPEWSGAADGSDHGSVMRRTSTDRDALPVVRLADATTEQRLDHSAGDLARENTFDTVQDDSGPQTDRS
jgi:hypothetical protein